MDYQRPEASVMVSYPCLTTRHPRSGAPRKLSQAQQDHILNRVRTDPKVTHKDLLVDIDYTVKKRALRGFLYYHKQLSEVASTPSAAADGGTGRGSEAVGSSESRP